MYSVMLTKQPDNYIYNYLSRIYSSFTKAKYYNANYKWTFCVSYNIKYSKVLLSFSNSNSALQQTTFINISL